MRNDEGQDLDVKYWPHHPDQCGPTITGLQSTCPSQTLTQLNRPTWTWDTNINEQLPQVSQPSQDHSHLHGDGLGAVERSRSDSSSNVCEEDIRLEKRPRQLETMKLEPGSTSSDFCQPVDIKTAVPKQDHCAFIEIDSSDDDMAPKTSTTPSKLPLHVWNVQPQHPGKTERLQQRQHSARLRAHTLAKQRQRNLEQLRRNGASKIDLSINYDKKIPAILTTGLTDTLSEGLPPDQLTLARLSASRMPQGGARPSMMQAESIAQRRTSVVDSEQSAPRGHGENNYITCDQTQADAWDGFSSSTEDLPGKSKDTLQPARMQEVISAKSDSKTEPNADSSSEYVYAQTRLQGSKATSRPARKNGTIAAMIRKIDKQDALSSAVGGQPESNKSTKPVSPVNTKLNRTNPLFRVEHNAQSRKLDHEVLMLFRLRAQGLTWSQVSNELFTQTGNRWANDTCRRRHIRWLTSLEDAGVGRELIEHAMAGEPASLHMINNMLAQYGMSGQKTSTLKERSFHPLPGNDKRSDEAKKERAISRPRLVELQQTEPFLSQGEAGRDWSSPKSMEPSSPTVSDNVRGGYNRPTTGGKTINEDFWRHHFLQRGHHDDLEDCAATELEIDDPCDDESTADPRDLCYYTYTIHRRTISTEQQEEDVDPDNVAWIQIGEAYEQLEAAVVAAEERISTEQREMYEVGWTLQHHPGENGLRYWRLDNAILGSIETCISRTLRTVHEQTLPKTKRGWLPRLVYRIMERKETQQADGDAGQTKSMVLERVADDATFTCIQAANERAVDHFVRLLMLARCKTLNLDARQQEAAEMAERVRFGLGEDDMFSAEDAELKIRVWVQQSNIVGPRNL